ncbi:unnamed protein product [Cylicocyclus nassatus]|uniref:Fatty-acid and retinol-binding protein 1 n=1 Tax=Cylicocyclus nassatus TaxID=53992 RepID=A0AA36GQY2_CYLNA|nr:unnamed protein product [Cylicocyclus nassatus]
MFGRIFAIAAVLSIANAEFLNLNDLPDDFKEIVPKEAKDFLMGLTPADKKVIEEVTRDYSTKSEDEALAALKAKSPELGAKAEKLHSMVREKVDALGDEAKAFVKEVLADMRHVHSQIIIGKMPSINEMKEKSQNAINKYKALSDSAKDDLQKQFPILCSVFKSEKLQKLAEKLLSKN